MKIILLSLLCIVSVKLINAQTKLAYLSYVFSQDSLSGFDETGANQAALRGGYFGAEYKVFMYRAKRNFINRKYGYSQYSDNDKKGNPIVNAVGCLNEDFELSPVGPVSSISGWTITTGQNINSCSMAGCCTPTTLSTINTWIKTTPFISPGPVYMTVPNSPLGGNKILQMNDSIVNIGEVIRLEQIISVTAANYLIDYAYIFIANGTGHNCCDQPFFNVLFYDNTNNLIPAVSASIVVPGAACASSSPNFSITSSSGISYHTGWQVKTANLSSYIGTSVTIQVTVGDCDGWAHYGYAYFDAKCSGSTGIENTGVNEEKIKIYPNPNSGEFVIRAKEEDIITITNEIGQTLKTVKLNSENNYSATISGLANGIYFASGKKFKEKIVVMK